MPDIDKLSPEMFGVVFESIYDNSLGMDPSDVREVWDRFQREGIAHGDHSIIQIVHDGEIGETTIQMPLANNQIRDPIAQGI